MCTPVPPAPNQTKSTAQTTQTNVNTQPAPTGTVDGGAAFLSNYQSTANPNWGSTLDNRYNSDINSGLWGPAGPQWTPGAPPSTHQTTPANPLARKPGQPPPTTTIAGAPPNPTNLQPNGGQTVPGAPPTQAPPVPAPQPGPPATPTTIPTAPTGPTAKAFTPAFTGAGGAATTFSGSGSPSDLVTNALMRNYRYGYY